MPSAEISMKIKHCWSRVSEGEIALDQGRTNGVQALILLVQACTELIQCSAPHMVDPVRDSQSKVGHLLISKNMLRNLFSISFQKPSNYGPGHLGDIFYYSWESVAARDLPIIILED